MLFGRIAGNAAGIYAIGFPGIDIWYAPGRTFFDFTKPVIGAVMIKYAAAVCIDKISFRVFPYQPGSDGSNRLQAVFREKSKFNVGWVKMT